MYGAPTLLKSVPADSLLSEKLPPKSRVIARHRYESCEKRDGTVVSSNEIGEIVGREPTPEFAVEVADQCDRLVSKLSDTLLREIAILKMEGYTNDEIAGQLQTTTRTVERKLQRIREVWSQGT